MSNAVRPLPFRSALEDRCRRALVAAAREQGAVSRDDLRRAARRFVKRHRRDAGYLRWVLESVAANAALALTLLGFGLGFAPTAAEARATFFVERTGAANPAGGFTTQIPAAPTVGDLDGDGDLDLVSSNGINGNIRYWQNTSTNTSPAFVERTGAQNPLTGFALLMSASAHLADVDSDGDLDVVITRSSSDTLRFLRNTGSATNPAFVEQTGAASPFPSSIGSAAYTGITHGDLDGDGDVDFLQGNGIWIENTGEPQAPAFVARTGAANPFSAVPGFDLAVPELADLDRDGDLDLVFGTIYGLTFVENTGTAIKPAFVVRAGRANPWAGIPVPPNTTVRLALGDFDRDGDLDMIGGTDLGTFRYFENRAGAFRQRTGADDPLAALPTGQFNASALGDVDKDGDLDIVMGEFYGSLRYFQNSGTAVAPAYVERTGAQNPFAVLPSGYYLSPALADLDGDGDLDVVVGRQEGTLTYLENTSVVATPTFVIRAGPASPLNGLVPSSVSSAPALADLDGDGDRDLVVASQATFDFGTLDYFRNTGTASQPAFVAVTNASNPLFGAIAPQGLRVALGDTDGDGDVDAVVGRGDGTFLLLENRAATVRSPLFQAANPTHDPVAGIDVGYSALPALGDLDGDGDADLVSGAQDPAPLRFLENATVQPSLIPVTLINGSYGGGGPLTGVEPLYIIESPAFGDLDSDGDPDLVTLIGDTGTFRFLENTGSRVWPSFVGRSGAQSPVEGVPTGLNAGNFNGAKGSGATLFDLDGDGDLDLFGTRPNTAAIAHLENTGNAGSPAFALRTGAASPLTSVAADLAGLQNGKPFAFGDLDGDADPDLVVSNAVAPGAGELLLFENTGTRTSPAFLRRTGAANPLAVISIQDRSFFTVSSQPAIADFDGDGDLDLALTPADRLSYVENTGTPKSPAFVVRTGANAPLPEEIPNSTDNLGLGLTAADLDGDLDPDLVLGVTFQIQPRMNIFLLPEPLRGAALAVGALALRLFAGWRRARSGGRRDERD